MDLHLSYGDLPDPLATLVTITIGRADKGRLRTVRQQAHAIDVADSCGGIGS